jgi:hypothetical protein
LIKCGIEDFFDTSVAHITKVERPGAGGFQTLAAHCLFQAQDSLHGSQSIQRSLSQQGIHHLARG